MFQMHWEQSIQLKQLLKRRIRLVQKCFDDAAQSLQHFKVDVQKLDCDFLVFSGHKIFGPTGTGVLYGKETILNAMPPYQGGGDMIKTVSMQKTVYNELPHKFEAGTPNISGGICLGVAVDWLSKLDLLKLEKHENVNYWITQPIASKKLKA
jgi:cysteine desulfurase/selenocysteine lyase